MYTRAKYKDSNDLTWTAIRDPVGTIKYDGANFWMPVSEDGSLSFISRRPSVKGGFPNRTPALPHLTTTKHPEFAGHIYNVELIHTGFDKNNVDSHRTVSGILNSLPERAINTQKVLGPIRAVIHNVINPEFGTYKDKLEHLKHVEERIGKPDLIYSPPTFTGHSAISDLINSTRQRKQEGVIITSLSTPESHNPRVKIKHKITYNLRVSRILQEFDKNGSPKESMGSLEVVDATGRVVANVGSGFSRAQRLDAWNNKEEWLGKLIQVETMGLARNLLRMPIYNGDADGDLDTVE